MFKIRKATVSDIPLIRQLTFQVWPQTYASIISKEQIDYMLDQMYSESSLEKQMSGGSQFVFAYDEADPVGFASFGEEEPNTFKLHKLYVLPSQQGKGTGKWLVEEIIKEVKLQGAATLFLQVNRNNKARQFYEKLGFTMAGKLIST